ncbi:MAG: type II secretion system protein [Planctomycetota bacterium]
MAARHVRRPAFNVRRPPAASESGGRAFTLVELLVVVGIIALLVTILMPALGKAMELARRAVCATNLGSIGRGLMLYNTEHECYPFVPLNGAGWGVSVGTNRDVDPFKGGAKDRSPSSCLYLLLRTGHASAGAFTCPSTGEDADGGRADEFWDFADGTSISYAVMNPYGPDRLFNVSTEGGRGLLADSSPYFDLGTGLRNNVKPVNLAAAGISAEKIREGNSPNHRREGQNVSRMGGSTHWKTRADVGRDQDNIYTRSDKANGGDRKGSLPDAGPDGSADNQGPAGPADSWLVQ